MRIIFIIHPFDFFNWLLAQPLMYMCVCVCVCVSRDRLENILSAKTNKRKKKKKNNPEQQPQI